MFFFIVGGGQKLSPAVSDTQLLGYATTGQISKNTWTASDPVAVAEWMLDYLPVQSWILGNVTDTTNTTEDCAVYGKVVVGNMSHSTAHNFFQLHAVSAPDRPSGDLEVIELEQGFVSALGNLSEVATSGKWVLSLKIRTQTWTSVGRRVGCELPHTDKSNQFPR